LGSVLSTIPPTLFRQRTWRIIGGVAVFCCAALAWGAGELGGVPLLLQLAYWSAFALFLLVALYTVLLDLRYIRLKYFMEQRELFRQTIGEESFRRALRETQDNRAGDEERPENTGNN
jgi:hypothetical protein